jgi:hypothetical protein
VLQLVDVLAGFDLFGMLQVGQVVADQVLVDLRELVLCQVPPWKSHEELVEHLRQPVVLNLEICAEVKAPDSRVQELAQIIHRAC